MPEDEGKLGSLSEGAKNYDKALQTFKRNSNKFAKPISTKYTDDIDVDIEKFNEAKEVGGAGHKLTVDSFVNNQDKFESLKREKEILLNDKKAREQSLSEKVLYGTAKFAGRVFTSVLGSTVGTMAGLMAWARDGDFRSFYDNAFQDSLDGINEYLAEAMPHYYTSDENDWEISNFIFDKVFDGLGFATGAVISSYTGAGIVGNLQKGKTFSKFLKSAAVRKLDDAAKAGASQSTLRNLSENVIKKEALGARLSNIPKTAAALTTGAVYESGVEARHAYDSIMTELVDTYKAEHNGEAPIPSELKAMQEIAGKSANGIFAANMAVVGGSTFLQFGKHLGIQFKNSRGLLKPSVAKEVEEGFVKAGSKGARLTKKVLEKPFVESQEEMLQSVISNTGQDYAAKVYKDDDTDLMDLLDSTIKSFKKVYTSKEGWEEGLIGAIVGGMGVVGPKTKADGKVGIGLAGGVYESVTEFRQDEAMRDNLVDMLNSQDLVSSLINTAKHHKRQNNLSQAEDYSILSDNQYAYENAKDEGLFSYVESRANAGMVDQVYKDIDDLAKMPIEDFKETFGITDETTYNDVDRNKEIQSLRRKVKAVEEDLKFVDRVYPDVNQDTKSALAFNKSMFTRMQERKENIGVQIDELTGGTFTINDTSTEPQSKEEVFKDVPADKKTFNKKEYEALYDDYLQLDSRQKTLAKEWELLTTDKGRETLDEFLTQAKKEGRDAKKDRVRKKKEATKTKLEQEEKSKTLNEEILKRDAAKSDANTTVETINKAQSQPKTDNIVPLDLENIDKIIENISNFEDGKELSKFINSIGTEYDSLPKSIKNAIEEKKQAFQRKADSIQKEEDDPTAIDPDTNDSEITKSNREQNVNEGTELNVPTIDLTNDKTNRNKIEETINQSNQGKSVEGFSNEDVQKGSKGIYLVGRRLVDAFNVIAVRTRNFIETSKGIKESTDEIDSNTSLDILNPDLVKDGEKVNIRLYQEEVLEATDSEGNPITIENEIGNSNQIMEVLYNDEVIGYIHDLNYITDKRVVSKVGEIEDNVSRNAELLRSTREEIYNHLQNNQFYNTEILSKTAGSILTKANGRYDAKLSEVIANDDRVELLVVKETGLYLGNQPLEDTELGEKVVYSFDEEFYQNYSGATVVAVPAANGQYILSLARNSTVEETSTPVTKTIMDVVDAYISNDLVTLESMDFASVDNNEVYENLIVDYISNFIYTTANTSSDRYLYLGLDDKTGEPKVRFKDKEGSTIVVYNEGNRNSKRLLEDRINNSLISTNLTKLAEEESFKLEGKDVKYRDFLLDNLYVNFNGKDVITSKGTIRSYVANPIIALDLKGKVAMNTTPEIEDDFISTDDIFGPSTESNTEGKSTKTNVFRKTGLNRRNKRSPKRVYDKQMLVQGLDLIIDETTDSLVPSKQVDEVTMSMVTALHSLIKEDPSIRVSEAFRTLEQDLTDLRDNYEVYSKQDDISLADINNMAMPTVEENEEMARAFNLVLDNFINFKPIVLSRLKVLGYTFNQNRLIESTDETELQETTEEATEQYLDGETPDITKKSYDDGATFTENPLNKISAEIKLMLSTIPNEEANILGLDSYYELDTVYGSLLDILSNRTSDTLEDTVEELKKHVEDKPYLQYVIDTLESSETSQQDKNMFNSHFKTNYLEHELIVHNTQGSQESFKVIKSNRNTLSNTLLEDWLNNTALAPVFKSELGKIVVDQNYVSGELNNLWKLASTSKSVADTKKFLEAVGIRMSTESLDYIKENSKNISGLKVDWEFLFTGDKTGVFKIIKETFESDTQEDINPLSTEGYVKTLANIQSRFTEDVSTSSFRNAEGKTIFSYINSTWLVNRFSKIKNKDGDINTTFINRLKSIPYLSSSWYLEKLTNDPDFARTFNVTVTDTLKDGNSEGKKFSRLSPREKVVAQINMFINSQQGKNKYKRIGKFFVSKSDKHVLHLVTALRHNVSSSPNQIKNGEFHDKDKKQLLNIVRSEYARIIDAQTKREDGINFKDIKGYDPFKFYSFESLNDVEQLYDTDGNLIKWSDNIEDLLWESISSEVKQIELDTKASLIDMEIISEDDLLLIDNSYKEEHNNNVDYFVRDYVLNNMIATSNYSQIFQGDVAFAFKKNIEGAYANMFKRLAKDMAPAVKSAKNLGESYNKYKQIFLKDAFNSSLNIDQLRNSYPSIAKDYEEIEGTDAQEVTTLAEHLNVLYHYGKLTDEQYNNLYEKAERGSTLSEEDLQIALQPLKPVYVGQKYMPEYNAEVPVYIKSSSYPLVPQLVEGTEFEKLEKIMRSNDISRAVFESGVKLGGYKIIDGWNRSLDDKGEPTEFTDGTFNEDLIKQSIKEGAFLELDRDNFGIQQDVPYDPNKDKIIEGSQLMKLIQSGIVDSETIKRFNDLHNDLTSKAYEEFLKEIGFQEKEDGSFNYTDVYKLREMLISELIERGSYTSNDITALDLNEDSTDFKVPLWSNPKASQFEALLNSIVNKRILKHKMPGKSYVLGTEEGWLGYSNNIERITSGLIGTRYDSRSGLKPQRLGYKEKVGNRKIESDEYNSLSSAEQANFEEVVFPAQVLMTRGQFNQRQVVGYRIPTQDLNSMSAMEVVGYLPEYMADLLIAPKDFVIQMGSDFDIDKLYVHRWHENDKGGKISKSSTQTEDIYNKVVQNEIMDIYWSTLTNKSNLERILKPLDFGNLPEVKEKLSKVVTLKKHHPLSPLYQMQNYENGNAGKFGVGVTSLASTTNALIQATEQDISLKRGTGFDYALADFAFTINGEKVNVSSIKGDMTLDGTMRKADVISAFQSASVDNIKELLINIINYNKHTHDTFITMSFLGLNDKYISYLLAQPAIKRYVEVRDNLSDSFSKESNFNAEEAAYNTVYNELADQGADINEGTLNWNKPYSEEGLLKAVSENNPQTQANLLSKFSELASVGKELNNIIRAIQPATSGIGKSRISANIKFTRVEDAINSQQVTNVNALLGERTGDFDVLGNEILTPTTIAGQGVEILRKTNNLYDNFFGVNTVANRLAREIADNRNSSEKGFTERERMNMVRFIKSYIYSANLKMYAGENINSLRERLLFGKDSIAHRWNKYKQDNPNDWLAKRIKTRASISESIPSTISYTASQADRTDDIHNTHTLIEMLSSNDPIKVALAEDTIAYTYITGGNQNANSILKFIPNNYLNVVDLGKDSTSAVNQLILKYLKNSIYNITLSTL